MARKTIAGLEQVIEEKDREIEDLRRQVDLLESFREMDRQQANQRDEMRVEQIQNLRHEVDVLEARQEGATAVLSTVNRLTAVSGGVSPGAIAKLLGLGS